MSDLVAQSVACGDDVRRGLAIRLSTSALGRILRALTQWSPASGVAVTRVLGDGI